MGAGVESIDDFGSGEDEIRMGLVRLGGRREGAGVSLRPKFKLKFFGEVRVRKWKLGNSSWPINQLPSAV